jgi:hypothetical protein
MPSFSDLSDLSKMDLKTPENRAKARKQIQEMMLGQVKRALSAYHNLKNTDKRKIAINIGDLLGIKARIEATAVEKGYTEACKTSIPICKGECCKWHFPKNLSMVDFFIAINSMSPTGVTSLVHGLTENTGTQYKCPMLKEKGCIFSFEERPVVCTIAYPCFAGQIYWEYHQKEKKRIENIYGDIENIIRPITGEELGVDE